MEICNQLSLTILLWACAVRQAKLGRKQAHCTMQ